MFYYVNDHWVSKYTWRAYLPDYLHPFDERAVTSIRYGPANYGAA